MIWITCEEPRLGVSHLDERTDRHRLPLQDEDDPGNDRQLVPGFPPLYYGTFTEWVRSVSVSVGSTEIRLI